MGRGVKISYACGFNIPWVEGGYTNVLKIDLKCPEKYIKAYIFFIIQWIEFKFENVSVKSKSGKMSKLVCVESKSSKMSSTFCVDVEKNGLEYVSIIMVYGIIINI
jgi:hypothetical protein